MKKELNYISTAFKTEWLKINGLGLKLFAVIVAVLLSVLEIVIKIFKEKSRVYEGEMISLNELKIAEYMSSFGGFFLLVFIIVAATRIAQTDHKNNGWTFLETQPLSKFSIYSGKFLALALLSLFSITVFFVVSIVVGYLMNAIFPQENISTAFDFYIVIQSFVRLFVLSLGLVSLQMMLSVIIPGFIWPFVLGFVGFVVNVVGKIKQQTYDFFPYNYLDTGLSFEKPSELNNFFNYTEYLSLFWTVLFFIIGYLWYSRRGLKNAFFKNGKVILRTVLGLAVFGAIYYFITKPIYPEKGELTIIEGKVTSKDKVDKILITSSELGEKIAEIPVKDGEFYWESKADFPLGEYILEMKGKRAGILFSKGDHLIFDIKSDPKNFKTWQKGTRKAEHAFRAGGGSGSSYFYSYVVENKQLTNDPEKFYELAQEEWGESMKKIEKFRTKENIHIGDDFREYEKQVNAVKMLGAIQNYQKITSFSEKKFAPPAEFKKEVETVLKNISPLILTSEDYKTWKLNTLLPNEGTKNPDSIMFVKLSAMPASEEKDRLLSFQLLKAVNLMKDENQRNELFAKKVGEFKNDKFKSYTANQLQVLNNQQKGKPFPTEIQFQNEEGKMVNLSQFKGKFVVIDFWATWCVPCRETSPVFDYHANNYSYYENLVFLSASIDQDKNKWKMDIKNSKSNVTKWWVVNQNALQLLGVDGIPRFIMIDPEGKIFNANLPRPSETNFTDILDEVADSKSFSFSF